MAVRSPVQSGMKTAYRDLVQAKAGAHGLPWDLVEAVVFMESAGHTDAFRYEPEFWVRYLKDKPEYRDLLPRRVSSSYGLMQVMLPVARECGFTGEPEELFVPATGLEFGCRKLATEMYWAGGNINKALGAYNAGRGGWNSPAGVAYSTGVLRTRQLLDPL